jgi:23S rRNA (uracil1939-C5)-methyltransferase
MEVLEMQITDLARGGAGVAREASGRVIFVPLTLPGDRVRVRIVEAQKRFAQGEVLELLQPSPDRAEPPCPYFGWGPDRCGGCEWQHVPYEIQWRTKVEGLAHALSRAGVEAADIPRTELPAPEGERFGYRNRIQLRGEGGQVGFRARGSQRLVPIDECRIARPELNAELPRVREEGARLHAPYKTELEVLENGQIRAHWNQKHAHGGFRQVHDAQNARLREWVAARVSVINAKSDAGRPVIQVS